MKIGFTGTRDGMTEAQAEAFGDHFRRLGGTDFLHGACVGADADAVMHVAAMRMPGEEQVRPWCRTHAYPSDLKEMTSERAMELSDFKYKPKPPLDRNRDIVDACDVLMACPKGPEEQRSGTWSTIRYARRLRKKIVICWPDGQVTEE